MSLNYMGLIAPIVKAMQDMKAANDNEFTNLKSDNDNLRHELEESPGSGEGDEAGGGPQVAAVRRCRECGFGPKPKSTLERIRAGTQAARQCLRATAAMMESPMPVKTMNDLFVATLKDIYYAEKQILKALPTMVKKAKGAELKDALETHRQETEGQVERLDKVFKLLNVPARGKKCDAIEGIIDEAKEHMEEIENEQVLDAGMISSAQAVEHYEICRYGTLIEWAKDLGLDDAVALLQQNLDEEKNADKLLSKIARSSSNQKAMAAE